jgi:hypothetical protein
VWPRSKVRGYGYPSRAWNGCTAACAKSEGLPSVTILADKPPGFVDKAKSWRMTENRRTNTAVRPPKPAGQNQEIQPRFGRIYGGRKESRRKRVGRKRPTRSHKRPRCGRFTTLASRLQAKMKQQFWVVKSATLRTTGIFRRSCADFARFFDQRTDSPRMPSVSTFPREKQGHPSSPFGPP